MKKLILTSVLCIYVCTYSQNYPFPQQNDYPYGIKPNTDDAATMNKVLQDWFNVWRPTYLTSNGCPTEAKRIISGLSYGNGTCSEAQSYGMQILVYMDNWGNQTRNDFDACFKYYKFYLHQNSGLMLWWINSDGTVNKNDWAGDADEEVAFSLLMADKQWGSNGNINYYEEAKKIIRKLEIYNVNLRYDFSTNEYGWLFPAYFMPHYWKEFQQVTNNDIWSRVTARSYQNLNEFQDRNYGNGYKTGLVYDAFDYQFNAVDNDHAKFSYDACRVPWRIGTDYLWNGESQYYLARYMPSRITQWAKVAYGGNPANSRESYSLDGNATSEYTSYGCTVGPMMVGAMTNSKDQAWLNTLYEFAKNIPFGQSYYDDNVLFLSMLTATGNMPNFRVSSNKFANNSIELTADELFVPTSIANQLQIKTSLKISELILYNNSGQKIKEFNLNYNNLYDFSDINKGFYLIKVSTADKEKVYKIWVN